jgi:Siphovirus ReqiPepy6 Gp37-like protein
MIFYTMDRQFNRVDEIDSFISGIWTERYYGDSEVELIVPATSEMVNKLYEGVFLGEESGDEPMIIETADLDDEKGTLKLNGISILKWLNNRFIRGSAAPEDKYWNLVNMTPGMAIWTIIYYFCIDGDYLNGSINVGIPNMSRFKIPNFDMAAAYWEGDVLNFAIPYGPVYDAVRSIATTYSLGIKVYLEQAPHILLLIYTGQDRTSRQSGNNIVRFSEDVGSLTKVKELRSISNLSTVVYSFCPSNPDGLATSPGTASLATNPTGFDLRALMTFEEDITTDQTGGDPNTLLSILNQRAAKALDDHRYVKTIDGEIVPDFQFKYGVDYRLGDLIEVQGISGSIQISRVTEHIRAQDAAGERSYPTVTMLE